MKRTIFVLVAVATTLTGGQVQARDFEMFSLDNERCYDRAEEPSTFVVDTHVHFQPFGGEAIPFDEMLEFFQAEEIYFINAYGIGQKLPAKSSCTYYLDCPGTTVTPSITNDFVNASNLAKHLPGSMPENVNITLSMSFTNLAEPESVVPQIRLLDREFPGMFGWMGEINVIKQAIFPNGHFPTPREEIEKWSDFMRVLEERSIPVSLHSDLGNDDEPTKYLEIMPEILARYPGNIIVWHHLGLSRELSRMDPERHSTILKTLLDEHPNLYLDISWSVLYDNYFRHPKKRSFYVRLFDEYSTRILPGTDFVASANKTLADYEREVELNSDILKDLSDDAFRNIALGQNYFNILGLPYRAPSVCGSTDS